MTDKTVAALLARRLLVELSISTFRSNINAARRALWLGEWVVTDFIAEMIVILERGFEQAAREGESECGILPGERSLKGRTALIRYSVEQEQYIEQFALDIEKSNKASGGLLSTTDYRVNMWVNRYNEVVNLMRTIECADRKYEWVLGPTEHCPDCQRLAGKVKRGSVWDAYGIRPQSASLACGGYNCKCELVPTDKPLSRGPLPKLIGR